MKTTLIAVSYGGHSFRSDPYTTSDEVDPDQIDINNAKACRQAIAKLKKLPIDSIDEVLVIQDSEVVKQHGGQNGF